LYAQKPGVGPCGGRRRTATTIIDRCEKSHRSSRKPLLLLLFRLLLIPHRHTSCRYDVSNQRSRRSDQFGMEAAETTAPMPTGMLFLTSLGRHRRLPGTLPYLFLRRTQPTTTPQSPSTRRDVKCQQRPSWCPTPGAAAYNSRP